MTIICFLNNKTNTNIFNYNISEIYDLSKKNLYKIPKIIIFEYEIGEYINSKYKIIKTVNKIIKPFCINISEELINKYNINNKEHTDIKDILTEFFNDIKDVNLIITYNCQESINFIIAECLRYNIYVNINKYKYLDLIDYYKLYNKTISKQDNITDMITDFFSIYNYSNS